jgi:radical SAM protein with 4Fe4S-binding SPASM domain
MKWNKPLLNAVIEITNRCNLRCKHCGSDSGKARVNELSNEEIISLLEELRELGCVEITLLGGEVFLREGWEDIARAVTKNSMRLIVITNGLLMNEENYRKLQETGVYLIGISIDGPDKDKYEELRGVDGFDKVINLLKQLIKDPLFPNVNAITTFTRDNLPWFDDFVTLFEGTNITWQVQIANKGGSRFDEEMFITRDDYSWFIEKSKEALNCHKDLKLRFMDDFGYFPFTPDLAFLHQIWEGCIAGSELVGIRSDGKVCGCLSLGEKFMEADLRKESLTEIWTGGKYFKAFRERDKHLSGKCSSCEMSTKCKAGCAAMAVSSTKSLGENAYCIRQLEEEKITDTLWGDS